MRYPKYTKKVIFIVLCIIASIYILYRRYYHIESFQDTTTIPTYIWQTYKTKELSAEVANIRNSWITKNPGWTVELYDDDDIDRYIKTSWEEDMYSFYKALPLGVMKADLWRYLILTTHGGVYADIDSLCLKPVNEWFKEFTTKDALVVSPEMDGVEEEHFCQWTMYCTKEHPAMRFIAKFILNRYIKNGINIKYEHFVHETTGPNAWTDAIKSYLNMDTMTAKKMFKLYTTNPAPFVEKGIYILSPEHFQGIYSKNMYGSHTFGDGYVSWTKERDSIVQMATT